MRRPAVENCSLHLRNRRGGSVQPPQGGLANEARNVQLPGILRDFHPRTMAAAEGRWGSRRPAVENCGLRVAKPPGAVQCSPRQGAWQTKPATSSCRAFCAVSTHGRWPRPKGSVARRRPAVENCGLRGAKPPGAVGRSPREGTLQTKPATSSCRAFCAISTHGRWPRPRAWGRNGRQLKLWPSVEAKPPGAVGRSPARGHCKRSPQRPVAGRSVRFPPTDDGRGRGRWP